MVGFHRLLLTERQTIKKVLAFDLYGPLAAPTLLLVQKDQTATNAIASLKYCFFFLVPFLRATVNYYLLIKYLYVMCK